MSAKVFENQPPYFQPHIRVAACYVAVGKQILLLQRSIAQSQSGAWGLPGGKLEKGESHEQAALRELFEETGISLQTTPVAYPMKPFFIETPALKYTFFVFYTPLKTIPSIILSPEHASYAWAGVEKAITWPLMENAKEILISCQLGFARYVH